ncbi:MAG: Radical SAM superfamily enzyme, MoaA/NifB/PqqE/SkfB family [Chloroflexi bacterium]|nr:MAG: Radical SAM superfamily enzyme, MoaA/NifB/PqqE/SkfB family [Chloroflexota bacterium]
MVASAKPAGSLRRRSHPLAEPAAQRAALDGVGLPQTFAEVVAQSSEGPLSAGTVEVLQINVGKYCNQTCRHCHVDAGPDRTEIMSDAVVDACLAVIEREEIGTVDITGGAPELHPRFREIVEAASAGGGHVIDRANLTAFLMPEQRDLPAFLAERGVEIVASLPYYLAGQTDAQRGVGVFDRSLEALGRLNALGYGVVGSGLELNLIANPVGAFLPPSQASMEADWRRELDRRYGVQFNHLYALTNLPVGRYIEYLQDSGNLEDYVHMLAQAFNPATLPALMCRNTISVGWDGALYDCDFNQMLQIDLLAEADSRTGEATPPPRIFDLELERLWGRRIAVGPHCFGCTAGAGASCGGSLA